MDTVPYEDDTLFVINREIGYGDPDCCPKKRSDVFYYDNSSKRLRFEWTWADASNFNPDNTINPILQLAMRAKVEKRNDFWGNWNCHRRHMTFNIDVDWWVVPTRDVYHKNLPYTVRGNVYTCRVSGSLGLSRGVTIGPYNSRPKIVVCVYHIEHTANIFESLDLPPEETFVQSCTETDARICNICPSGFTFDGANCRWNTACAPNGFVYQNGFYYSLPPGQTDCSEWGGTWDGANCYLGWIPSGWSGEGFYYNGCYYVRPHCP